MKLHTCFPLLLALVFTGCDQPAASGGKLTIGIAFETLQTEYWVAGFDALKAELAKRDLNVLEAIADQDANRQLQQVKNFIARKVDGIILVPKDAQTCLPMIKAANEAGIPIVLFNRPADKSDAKSVAVVADNFQLTRETVAFMLEEARKSGKKHKGLVILGDLGIIRGNGGQNVQRLCWNSLDTWMTSDLPSEARWKSLNWGVFKLVAGTPVPTVPEK